MRMERLVLHCILLFGRLLLILSVGELSELLGILPGFLGLLGCGLLLGIVCLSIVLVWRMFARWPFSVGTLVKIADFLGSLHWPDDAGDLGVGGFSYLEFLILHERWAGERLMLEGAIPQGRREGRPISVLAVPVGPGIDIWRSCRFLGSVLRFLDTLPGGLGRFLPCKIGAHHCRLRHLG